MIETAQIDGRAVRIIVVDDERLILSLVQDALADSGCQIEVAEGAREALEKLKKEYFDFILTDIRMPECDGIQLAHQAKEIIPTIGIIFMTGHANIITAKDAIKEGAYDYISKPFGLGEIREVIRNAIKKKQRDTEKTLAVELSRLFNLNQLMYTVGDRRSLMRLSLGFALMQGKTHRGSIFFRDGNENEIGVVATVEASPGQFMESSEKYEEDFMGLDSDIVNTPFVVTTMDEHPLYKKFQDPRMAAFLIPSWHTPGDRLINIPLRRGSKLYGFLILGFSDNDANLKNNDLKLLLITASQIAISLENIILLEEAKVAYDRLRDLQDQTIQLEKMATKGQMSAEIGHELNNFLNVVGGNLSQVKHQLDRKNYPEMEKYVNAVINNLGNIEKFTHGLMNFENMSLNFEFCDMNILIQGVIEYLRTQRLFQNVTIQLEKPPAPVFTMVDTGQMQQLLHNLINNAADATIGKTERLVSVVLTYDSENSDFTISVIDNGTGIDKGLLEKTFKARFTTKKTGHGFGLLVCKRIIDNHDAILNVDSSPGEGTTISINFPIKLPENKISTVK